MIKRPCYLLARQCGYYHTARDAHARATPVVPGAILNVLRKTSEDEEFDLRIGA